MQFGKYRLIRKLATGGMAEIFLARQEGMEGFQKELVIKRILPVHADNDELIEMFLDEARIAAKLNHPNIVQIYDLGRCDGEYFIAMEYVHGQDLRRICERGLAVGNFLPLRHAVRAIADAAAGLHYAHHLVGNDGQPLNIVHRDISPQNLIVSFDGVVKILDFGIAKAANKMVTTRNGQLKGKYAYMSPEQCNGLEVDQRSDIFSLGTLLYEITVCTRLFKGETDIQTIKNVSEAVVPLPTRARPGFPSDLEAILLKSLAKDPNDRYQNGREFQVALEDFLSHNRLKTGSMLLGNYMREIFPDKLDMPGEDPEFMAEAEAQARARAEIAAAKARKSTPSASAPVPRIAPDHRAQKLAPARTSGPSPTLPPMPAPIPAPVSPAPKAPKPAPEHVSLVSGPPSSGPGHVSLISGKPIGEAPPGKPPEMDEQVSFALNPNTPYAQGEQKVAEPPRKKKEMRKVAKSSVKTVEYRLQSAEKKLDNYDKGSKVYFYILGLVVLAMAGYAVFLLVQKGNVFAGSELLVGVNGKEIPEVQEQPPLAPLPSALVNVASIPKGASVVINGILQAGETPGDFRVVPGKINTISLYKENFKPRHKNIKAAATGDLEPLQIDLDPVVNEGSKEPAPMVKYKITSEPNEATVIFDGAEVGRTPMVIEKAVADVEHHVVLRKDGFHDHVIIQHLLPTIDNEAPMAKLISRERKGAERITDLTIDTHQAEILLEGTFAAMAPFFQPMKRNQATRIELKRKEHKPYRRVLATTVGSVHLSPKLEKIRKDPGKLSIKLLPKTVQMFVGSDEYEHDEVKKLDFPAGEYTVTLVKGKLRGEVKVTVDPESSASYEINFSGQKPSVKRLD